MGMSSNVRSSTIRRRWLIAGLVLTALAAPLIFVLGSMTLALSVAGALALTYAFLPTDYPLLGAVASFAFAIAVPVIFLRLVLS